MDWEALFGWVEQLDHLDYYELLGVPRDADNDRVRSAFQEFAATFHPDAHPARDELELEALEDVFKRGSEAYSVLIDPALRAQYDQALDRALEAADNNPSASESLPRMQSVPPPSVSGVPVSQRPPKLEDTARTPSARPFARRAEELVEKGDLRQAKLQMVMATHMDPGNDALEAYLRHIEEQLKPR
jgi:curved DNA-binding protein CbpA